MRQLGDSKQDTKDSKRASIIIYTGESLSLAVPQKDVAKPRLSGARAGGGMDPGTVSCVRSYLFVLYMICFIAHIVYDVTEG